jgi:hypothetical protein
MQGQARRVSVGVVLGAIAFGIIACSIDRSDLDPTSEAEQNRVEPRNGSGDLPERAMSVSVLEHHGNPTRDGFYIDPSFTDAAIRSMHRDTSFDGTVVGNVYAQPLYVERGPGGREAFIVATEQNHVTALDSAGAVIWDKTFGAPSTSNLPCGNIRPLGITGTPVIDAATRTIYFDTMTTPDGNTTHQHKIWAISLDDGSTKPGWPVDFAQVTRASAAHHNQRGALALVNGTLYVPYGGHFGDCDPYKGTVIGVPVSNPAAARSWSVAGREGGIWATGGLASDGDAIYAATGNTEGAAGWAGGEAILKLSAGPTFTNQPAEFFAPPNWQALDNGDVDLGGANPVLVDMPGAPVPHLVVAFGKDANIYLANRDNLGGIGGSLSQVKASSGAILGAGAAYKTSRGTYVAFRGRGAPGCPAGTGSGNLAVAKILPENPPRAVIAWCANERNLGSPMVTSADGNGKAIVWDANGQLWGYDGDTGEKVFAGGQASDALGASMQYFNSAIATKGRIAVAVPSKLVLFKP